jgi:hypothetical protein
VRRAKAKRNRKRIVERAKIKRTGFTSWGDKDIEDGLITRNTKEGEGTGSFIVLGYKAGADVTLWVEIENGMVFGAPWGRADMGREVFSG